MRIADASKMNSALMPSTPAALCRLSLFNAAFLAAYTCNLKGLLKGNR